MLSSTATNDFGSYRVSMADYRARRARPDPPTCQGAEPDLHLLKQVEQVTTLVVEGPAGQDSEHGVAVLVFIQQLWGLAVISLQKQPGGAEGVRWRRAVRQCYRPHPAVPRPGRMGCRAVALPNSVRLIHNPGNLACGPDFKVSHYPSASGFAEHDPAATAWRGECRQRRLCPNLDLPGAGRAAELLYAVGVHGRTAAPGPQIAAARAERVRSLDPDIAGVEREGVAAFDAVPLEALQKELRHRCIAVVRIEYIDVLGPKPGTLVHSPGGAVGQVLDLVHIFLCAALPEVVLRVIEHIDRRLPHGAGALGSRKEIRGRGIDRPVAVPEPERVQDVARIDVILDGELRYLVGGIIPPRRQQSVAVLVDDEGGEVVVLAAVFQAVLTVREDVDEIIAAVVAPGCRPLACA